MANRKREDKDRVYKQIFLDYYNKFMTAEDLAVKYEFSPNTISTVIKKFQENNPNWINLITNPLYKEVFDKYYYDHIPPSNVLGKDWMSKWHKIKYIETQRRNISPKELKKAMKEIKSKRERRWKEKNIIKTEDWFMKELKYHNRDLFLKVMTEVGKKTIKEVDEIIHNIELKHGGVDEDSQTISG